MSEFAFLASSTAATVTNALIQTPRSGQFNIAAELLKLNERKKDGDSAGAHQHGKKRFQVRLPGRLLFVLALIFLVLPILIFLHKEAHIHNHDSAHYKAEKFINVDTESIFNQFGARVGTNSNVTISSDDANGGEQHVEQQGVDSTAGILDGHSNGFGGNHTSLDHRTVSGDLQRGTISGNNDVGKDATKGMLHTDHGTMEEGVAEELVSDNVHNATVVGRHTDGNNNNDVGKKGTDGTNNDVHGGNYSSGR
jgi:hypothetical protein